MTEDPKKAVPGMPPMELPEDLAPVYSNMARISHTPSEIVVDFSRILPGEGKLTVLTRVLMSPIGAKLLLKALAENISRYEATFGTINVPGNSGLADDLFRNIHPPEPPKQE